MLPDEMEAEKNRKIILAQAQRIEILEKNVADLQQQLYEEYTHNIKRYKRVKDDESREGLG